MCFEFALMSLAAPTKKKDAKKEKAAPKKEKKKTKKQKEEERLTRRHCVHPVCDEQGHVLYYSAFPQQYPLVTRSPAGCNASAAIHPSAMNNQPANPPAAPAATTAPATPSQPATSTNAWDGPPEPRTALHDRVRLAASAITPSATQQVTRFPPYDAGPRGSLSPPGARPNDLFLCVEPDGLMRTRQSLVAISFYKHPGRWEGTMTGNPYWVCQPAARRGVARQQPRNAWDE